MEKRKARLNPFLFSPDTNFRFVLLVISVLGASLFAYNNIYNQLNQKEIAIGWLKCFHDAGEVFPLTGLEVTSAEYVNQAFLNNQYNNECNEPLEQPQARWILQRLALLLILAGAIYWFLPAFRMWQDKLSVFSDRDDPDIMACLLDLCAVIGLTRPPQFLVRALNSSTSGLAFGHLGRYYVVLNGGLITLFHQDRKRFEAIVLHELAHLVNQDVDKTYFSLAVGLSFLLVTLIPLAVGNILALLSNFGGNFGFVLWQTFSVTLYLPIIYMALASILRSREVYADARVLVLENRDVALRNELASLLSSRFHARTSFWGLHPKPAWRLKVFDQPDLFFGLSYGDAFLAGVISTFAFRELDIFLSVLLPPQYENYSLLGASLFFVPVVVSVVGLGVWQKVFAYQVHGQKTAGFGREGLSMGLGMLIGISLSFSSFIENSLAFTFSPILNTIAFDLLLSVLFLLSMFLIFRWVAVGASVWLETVNNPGNLRTVTSFGLLTTGLIMSFWVSGFYLLYKFGYEVVFILAQLFIPALQRMSEFSGLGLSIYTESILSSLILLPILLTIPVLLFIIVWMFPLLSRMRRSRTRLDHIFIEREKVVQLPAKIHSALRPFGTFLTGFIFAVGFIGMIALLRVVLHFAVGEDVRTTNQWLFNFRILQIGLAILLQILLATIVALIIKQLGWAHGIFAAFVAGLIIPFGLFLLPELSDCISILQLGAPLSCSNFLEGSFTIWLSSVFILGGFFSLLPAFIASWAGSFFRSQTTRPAAS